MNSDKSKPAVVAKSRSKKSASAESKANVVKIAEVVVETATESETARQIAADVAVSPASVVSNGAAGVAVPGTLKSSETVTGRVETKPAKSEVVNMQPRKPQVEAALPESDVATQLYDGMAAFNHDYIETVMNAADAMAKGFEALGTEWMNYAKTSLEDGMATSKSLMSCKSVDEAVDIQSGYVTHAVDSYLAESVKLSELSIKLANETVEPINSGLTVAIEELARSTVTVRMRTS